MKTLLILLSFLVMNSTSAIDQAVIHMCNHLTISGTFMHARISNPDDFSIESRGRYNLEVVSLPSHKENQKTDLILDVGNNKQTYILVNSCDKESESVVEI